MPKMRQARRHGGTRMWSLLMPPPQRATSIVCAITSVSITRALLLSLTAALCTRALCSLLQVALFCLQVCCSSAGELHERHEQHTFSSARSPGASSS